MSQDYSEYLAVNVLNERQAVTYRNLGRALKVHNNVAKQMLYEFHRKQNSKKPGSVHATYLLTGTKHTNSTNGSSQEAEDMHMNSSPPMPSSSFQQPDDDVQEVVPIRSVMVVKEEHLEKARAQFEKITGIHIYSLQAVALSDFQLLTDCNRRVLSEYRSEDPLKEWKQYGVIQNPHVQRRTRKNAPPIPAAAPAKKAEPAKAKPTAAPSNPAREDSQDSKASTKTATTEASKPAATKPSAATKKTGGLFKAFAKGAAKPKKSESQQSSAAASPAPVEDVPMTGFSDDDDDFDDGAAEEVDEEKEPTGPSRKDRKAELEAMMDVEDEHTDDAPEPDPAPEKDESQHDAGALDQKAAKEEESKETATVENGRRRGRRRVMKKKTVKDEEGYLVTKEEPVWEEFSEEEPAPKKAKISAPVASAKSGDKKPAKKGQGNIMSFFGKK